MYTHTDVVYVYKMCIHIYIYTYIYIYHTPLSLSQSGNECPIPHSCSKSSYQLATAPKPGTSAAKS